MKRELVYLAGKMTGLPLFNYDEFMVGARELRANPKLIVANPVELDTAIYGVGMFFSNPAGCAEQAVREGFNKRLAMAIDTTVICHADAIALLPNWRDSSGARAEKALADTLGLKVIYL